MTTVSCDPLSLHSWLCSSYLTICLTKSGSIILEFDVDGLRRYPTLNPQPFVDYDRPLAARYVKITGVDLI